ncbi:hypothetical protein Cni_G01765 [Canna indica]|uniref:DUF632 domain-containing protein n=1 Tax=Canna indica TaxID=4628 RepID=A0AAQ3JNQ6_9LILI|nr:hypothetical protein Cni_G01765 [Canna indica]
MEIDQWSSTFCGLIKSQREYTHSLVGWFRLSLFHCHAKNHLTTFDICSLCEELQLTVDRVPGEVASEGIKNFLTMVQAIIAQQEEEHNQEKRAQRGSESF